MLLNPTYNPIESLKNKIQQLFPRLDSIICLYKSPTGLSVDIDNQSLQISQEEKIQIQKIRNTSSNYQWIRPEDFVYLSKNENSNHQLQLMDEYNNRLLLIHLLSPNDQMKDTIAICFPKDVTFFGMHKTLVNLSTDEKSIVGELLQRTLYFDYMQSHNQKEEITLLNHYYEVKNKTYDTNRIENYITTNFRLLFKKYTQKEIIFEKEAIDILIDLNISFLETEPIFIKIVSLVNLIQPNSEQIIVTKAIVETVCNFTDKSILSTSSNEHYDKVYDLLERYEDAAQKAVQYGEVINGKIVASYLSPSVSPPAVSDSIKKNQQKIQNYLQKFPSKWMLIRKSLKPIRELDFSASNRAKLG